MRCKKPARLDAESRTGGEQGRPRHAHCSTSSVMVHRGRGMPRPYGFALPCSIGRSVEARATVPAGPSPLFDPVRAVRCGPGMPGPYKMLGFVIVRAGRAGSRQKCRHRLRRGGACSARLQGKRKLFRARANSSGDLLVINKTFHTRHSEPIQSPRIRLILDHC